MGAQYKEIQFEIEVDSNGCLKIQSISAQQKGILLIQIRSMFRFIKEDSVLF